MIPGRRHERHDVSRCSPRACRLERLSDGNAGRDHAVAVDVPDVIQDALVIALVALDSGKLVPPEDERECYLAVRAYVMTTAWLWICSLWISYPLEARRGRSETGDVDFSQGCPAVLKAVPAGQLRHALCAACPPLPPYVWPLQMGRSHSAHTRPGMVRSASSSA